MNNWTAELAPETINALLEPIFNEKVLRRRLDNGLEVIIKPDASVPLLSAQLWVKSGSMHEGRGIGSGLAHFVEHMLFKGTQRRSYEKIAQDVADAGGHVNAYTTFDRTVYYIDGPSESLASTLDVLSDIAFHSTFPKEEFKSERDVILREIDMGLDDPDRVLMQESFSLAFNRHPYRHPIIGHRTLFEQITHEQLWDFYKAHYVPNNMCLVVAGSLDPQEALKLIDQHFGQIAPKTLQKPQARLERPQIAPRKSNLFGDYQITRASLAYRIPGIHHEDSAGIDALASILGGGVSSILWQELREKRQLVHSIDTSTWAPGEAGLLFINFTCDPDQTDDALAAIRECIHSLHTTCVEDGRLAQVIRQTIVGIVNDRKSLSRQASRLGLGRVVLGETDYLRIYLQNTQSLTSPDLRELAQRYLTESQESLVSLEPQSQEPSFEKTTSLAGLPDFDYHTLPNGIRLAFQEVKDLPKVHVAIALSGGPLLEPKDKRGINALLASLLKKDTHKRSAEDIATMTDGLGASFTSFSGNNSFGLGLEVLNCDLPQTVDLLVDALLHPKLLDAQLEVEKAAQIASIKEQEDEIACMAGIALRKAFFGDHPYATSAIGQKDHIASITPQEIRNFHDRVLDPQNCVIALSGSFDKAWALNYFTKAFAPLKPKTYSLDIPSLNPTAQTQTVHMDREQVVVVQAYPDLPISDPDYEVAEVFSEIMSGMSSELFIKVREEQGLAYSVGSSRVVGTCASMFYFYAGTNPQEYEKVWAAFDEQVARAQSGKITAEELQRAQFQLKIGQRTSQQRPSSRSNAAALDALYNLPQNHWRTYPDRIDSVTLEGLQSFAQKYFKDDHKVRVAIGPCF